MKASIYSLEKRAISKLHVYILLTFSFVSLPAVRLCQHRKLLYYRFPTYPCICWTSVVWVLVSSVELSSPVCPMTDRRTTIGINFYEGRAHVSVSTCIYIVRVPAAVSCASISQYGSTDYTEVVSRGRSYKAPIHDTRRSWHCTVYDNTTRKLHNPLYQRRSVRSLSRDPSAWEIHDFYGLSPTYLSEILLFTRKSRWTIIRKSFLFMRARARACVCVCVFYSNFNLTH